MNELTDRELFRCLASDYVDLLRSAAFKVKDDKCSSDNLYEWIVELACDFQSLTPHGRVPTASLMISGPPASGKTCIVNFIQQLITKRMDVVLVTDFSDVFFRSPNVVGCLVDPADCQSGDLSFRKFRQMQCGQRLSRMVSSHEQWTTCLLKAYESKVSTNGRVARLQSQHLVAWLHLEEDRMGRLGQLLMVQSIACNATRACIMRHLTARIMAKAHWLRLSQMWRRRCIVFFWWGLKEARSCAPGGAGRAADEKTYVDEYFT
jgi:hypothetical protein